MSYVLIERVNNWLAPTQLRKQFSNIQEMVVYSIHWTIFLSIRSCQRGTYKWKKNQFKEMYRVINLNILISNMWQNDSNCWKQKFSIWSSDRKIKKIILRFIWFKEVHIVKCPTIYCIIFYFPLYPYQNLKILMMSFKMIKTLLTWQVCNSRFFEYIIFLCLIKVYAWSLSCFI